MIDAPVLLVALGMSAVSGLAYVLSRHKRRTPPPSAGAIATMSSAELVAMLNALQPNAPEYELIRRRVTLLLVEELSRRQHTSPV